MASSAGKLAIAIYILSNISRGKDNQTIKFAHTKQHEKDFLKKNNIQIGVKKLVRPFSIKSKLRRSLNQKSKI